MFPEPKRKHVSFKIKGFFVQDETEFYVDKRCAYMYKSKLTQCLLEVNQKKKNRIILEEVTWTHENSDMVHAKF